MEFDTAHKLTEIHNVPVRRKGWAVGQHVTFHDVGSEKGAHYTIHDPDGSQPREWFPSPDDRQAKDWEPLPQD